MIRGTRPTSTTPSWWRSRRCPTPLYNTIGTIVIALCGSDLIRQGKMPETRHQRFLHLQRAGGPVYGGGADPTTRPSRAPRALCSMWACCWTAPEEDPPGRQSAAGQTNGAGYPAGAGIVRLHSPAAGAARSVLHESPWQGDGHHRQQRLGQIHSAQTSPGHLCAGQRPHLAGRRAGGRVEALRTAAAVRVHPAKQPALFRVGSVTTSPTAKPARPTSARSSRRPGWLTPTALSASCQTAMTPTWGAAGGAAVRRPAAAHRHCAGLVHPPHLSADGRSRGQP